VSQSVIQSVSSSAGHYLFVDSIICSFVHLFVHSFVWSLICLFICSFVSRLVSQSVSQSLNQSLCKPVSQSSVYVNSLIKFLLFHSQNHLQTNKQFSPLSANKKTTCSILLLLFGMVSLVFLRTTTWPLHICH